jgi:anti-sigma factor ChrR (cupin superfamily)
MSPATDKASCGQTDLVSLYALDALRPSERSAVEAHISACPDCRQELEALRPTMDSFVFWPVDVLRPCSSLWGRLARRITDERGGEPISAPARQWSEPEWEEVAPGIFCKLLASDTERNRVSMLVRLAPGVSYPPHTHEQVEELHLLDGELWIDQRKLDPGDYYRAQPGTADRHVWSETGCTCVLMTSPSDVLS